MDMNMIVAANIKRLREERRLSLDELSRQCSVSKSMLAQIERGEGNPTVSTLIKIANGMRVPFDALTDRRESNFEIIKLADIEPVLEADGRSKNYTIFPDDHDRHFAVYLLDLAPGAFWETQSHLGGTVEYLTVAKGAVEVSSYGVTSQIHESESFRFRGDARHSYKNISDGQTVIYMILYTP